MFNVNLPGCTFHEILVGLFIGILIMAYYDPYYNWAVVHPLYNPTNQGFFHCSHKNSRCGISKVTNQLSFPSLFFCTSHVNIHTHYVNFKQAGAYNTVHGEKKSGDKTSDMVVYPIIYNGFIRVRWLFGISKPSTVCFRDVWFGISSSQLLVNGMAGQPTPSNVPPLKQQAF